jgi:threonine dehydratase
MVWIAGVDGCKAGWVAALTDSAGNERPILRVVAKFADLFDGANSPELVAVDMPIGLPDRVAGSGRGPEQLIRPRLGQRQSSVFSIPARAAVHATDYAQACRLAQETSMPPRKVSKQGFHLFPKIREIDALLRTRPLLRERVFEVHPELAFATMRGEALTHATMRSTHWPRWSSPGTCLPGVECPFPIRPDAIATDFPSRSGPSGPIACLHRISP